VKASTDKAHACAIVSPDDVASAPYETPYVPTATPTPAAFRTTGRRNLCHAACTRSSSAPTTRDVTGGDRGSGAPAEACRRSGLT
jgi:hypothetical protein